MKTVPITLKPAALLSGLALFFSAAAAEEELFSCDFNSPETLKGWNTAHWHDPEPATGRLDGCATTMAYRPKGGIDNSGCVEFTSTDPACNFLFSIPLDPEKVRGRGVILEGWLKAENLTKPEISYLGPKLMLAAVTAKGTADHPDQAKEYGSYGWKKFTAFSRTKADVTKMSVNLGIQGCTGKVWIDNVRVYLEPLPEGAGKPLAGQLPPNSTTRFRGVMSGADLSEAAFRELRGVWNANLLRFQISRGKGDHTTEAGFREIVRTNLERLDKILPLARKYGIKVVIDMHVGPGTSLNPQLSNQLSWEPAMQQLLIDVWREIAEKYRNEPMIYGYDLLNEPREENYVYVPGGGVNWNRLADRIARAIREVDPETPIVIEPHGWGGADGLGTFLPVNVPNVIYSIHSYNPGAYTHQGVMAGRPRGVVYPGTIGGKKFDRAVLEESFRPAIEFQKKYQVPIYVGEFGVARWAPNGEQWLDDMISIFEKYGWDWTFHSFREWEGWDAEIGSDPNDRTRIGDTPRRRVLLSYMKRNPPFELPPPGPEESGLVPDLETVVPREGQSVTRLNGVPVLTLTHKEVGSRWVGFPVNPAAIAGKRVELSAEIACEGISKAPRPWEGIKLMLSIKDDNGHKENPQATVGSGTLDWHPYRVETEIPESLSEASIVLGLEQVSGTVHYRRVKITILE